MSSLTGVTDDNASAPSSPRAWSIYNQQGDRGLYPLSPIGDDVGLASDAVRATANASASEPLAPSSPRAWSVHNQQGDHELFPSSAEGDDVVRATREFGNVEAWMDRSTVS